jgi:hypothetical protein
LVRASAQQESLRAVARVEGMMRGRKDDWLMNTTNALPLPGDGIEPEELPEAGRLMKASYLRELGLPFRCDGGEIYQDHSLTLAEELHDEDRESRLVYFRVGDEHLSVQYTRPVDCAISATFEPWPDEEEVFVTAYDKDQMGLLRMRDVGATH